MVNVNPFESSDAQRASRITRKSKVTWLLVGCLVSCAAWLTTNYMRSRPRDFSRSQSQFLEEASPEWMKRARGHRVGRFTLIVPADPSIATLWVQSSLGSNGLPGAIFEDEDGNGQTDSILVSPSQGLSLTFRDSDLDGTPDYMSYSRGNITFADNNLDGQPDLRIGPEREVAVWIRSAWRQLIREQNGLFIEIDGAKMQVDVVEGVYTLVNEIPE